MNIRNNNEKISSSNNNNKVIMQWVIKCTEKSTRTQRIKMRACYETVKIQNVVCRLSMTENTEHIQAICKPGCINSVYDYGSDYNVTSVLTVIRHVVINVSLSLWRDHMIYFLSCHFAKTYVTSMFPACCLFTAHSQRRQ